VKPTRVARWYFFKPKILIWVNFENGNVGTFYGHLEFRYCGHLVYFMAICWLVVIWYISPILVYCIKKNLATLKPTSLPYVNTIIVVVKAPGITYEVTYL
jgi:hypothetical protein